MRILHIMGSADYGGLPSVVYNYMRFIDREQFHSDFALNTHNPGKLGNEMRELGDSKFYYLPLRSQGISRHEMCLEQLLKDERFDAVHVHSGTTSYVDLRIAKKMGIPCRIAHSHATVQNISGVKNSLRMYSGRAFNRIYATKLVACGEKSGNDIFGELNMKSSKGLVLSNAVDTVRFSYNREIRDEVRKELRISNDKYVIGMVAAFSPRKNHIFALHVLEELCKNTPEAIMVFAGEGAEYLNMVNFCVNHGLTQNVRFLGKRMDINRLYSGFDICILPSLMEGLPVCGVEAITAGLPVLFADNITRELDFGENVLYLPLDEKVWVDTLAQRTDNSHREKGMYDAKAHGFEIRDMVSLLEKVYRGEL